jgi:hypothetical protein
MGALALDWGALMHPPSASANDDTNAAASTA